MFSHPRISLSLPIPVLFIAIGIGFATFGSSRQESLSPLTTAGVWQAQRSGTLARLSAVFFTDRERGWVVGSNGSILLTENGGNEWRRVPQTGRNLLRDVFFLDHQRGFVLGEYSLFDRPDNKLPKERSFLLASYDGGVSWWEVTFDSSTTEVEDSKRYNGDGLLRLLFVDDRTGWACGEAGLILVSRDSGRTWQMQRSPVRKLLYNLTAIDDQQAWIVGAGGVILRTVDGGRNWNEQSSGTTLTLRAIHFVDARRGWAVGAGGTILATTNGGNRWQKQSTEVEATLNDVVFTSTREGWIAGDHGTLLHTRDAGATWEDVSLSTRAHLLRLFFVAPDCGWVVGTNGVIYKYQRVKDD